MKNFFEVLGIADMEKVHSAVIGWMLSDDCEAFDIKARSLMLNQLFETSSDKIFQKIAFETEWKNIDIRYETTDNSGVVEYWVIENKIKSSQHSNQLAKYEEITKSDYSDYNIHYVFLSLVRERAERENWKNRCYDDLLEVLTKQERKINSSHSIIVSEYIESIESLVNAKNTFLENHTAYPFVFTEGSKSKSKKSHTDYISNNQLETIFQKLFLQQVVHSLKFEGKDKMYFNIHETRGNAAFGSYFNFSKDHENSLGLVVATADDHGWKDEGKRGKYPIFDFSFQNGTFKIALSKDYDKPSKKNIEEIKAWFDAFNKMRSNGYDRVNKGKSRARISLSKKININGNVWYMNSIEDIAEVLDLELKLALEIIQGITKHYFETKV